MKRLMTAVGMIVSVILGLVVAGTIAASDPATQGQVCPHGGGWFKYEAEGNWEPEQPAGISASINGGQATITVADGVILTGVCVKAGSANQGYGPETWTAGLPLDGPGQLTVAHSSGKDISHISVTAEGSEPEPSPSPSPNPGPDPTPEPTVPPADPAQPQPGEPGFAG